MLQQRAEGSEREEDSADYEQVEEVEVELGDVRSVRAARAMRALALFRARPQGMKLSPSNSRFAFSARHPTGHELPPSQHLSVWQPTQLVKRITSCLVVPKRKGGSIMHGNVFVTVEASSG